jgi:hypothetical protein
MLRAEHDAVQVKSRNRQVLSRNKYDPGDSDEYSGDTFQPQRNITWA